MVEHSLTQITHRSFVCERCACEIRRDRADIVPRVCRDRAEIVQRRQLLCRRCANNTPSGLNAPDPTLPRKRDVDAAADPVAERKSRLGIGAASLAALCTSRLPARAIREVAFDLPSDVLAEVRSRCDLAAIWL